jgi:hypothetical protein
MTDLTLTGSTATESKPATSTPPTDDRRFDDLTRLYELYSNIQMDIQTIYGNRANLILVAEGLLLVALPAVLDRQILLFAQLLAALGTWLSLAWLILEQRNDIHHTAREEAILKPLQTSLEALARETGRGFRAFWGVGSEWAKQHAAWYQTHSLRRVLRTYIPATFVIFWLAILAYITWKRL